MSIASYIAAVQTEAARDNATEHTFRPALKALIESLDTQITATNEPRRIACGAPDYQITRGALPVGHVEAKDLHVDLDREARGEQMARYLKALPNLILTNYLDFRWYVNGELRETARIGRQARGGKIIREPEGETDLARLLNGFLAQQPPVAGTPRDLALRLASMARLTRGLIAETFKGEGQRGELHDQYDAFKRALIPGLKPEEFADMYAQTLAYGLFAARVAHPEAGRDFSRYSAARLLPRTNPFLSKLFYEIAGPHLDDRIAWAVDDIAALLARANMDEILRDFGRRTRQEDPVVHFYETFLAAYDPKLRESRGVYYTPEPVVSFIVRSVDQILRTRFGKPLGLADRDALILDPATGTATFPYFVIEQIYETLRRSGMAGGWSSYVGEGEKSLLRRLFGFELLMAPYAVAHLKLGLQLQERGYDFRGDERLGVYLTNALDEGVPAQTAMPFARYIAEESQAAAEIKSEKPIMVVLGNPPYSGHSENRSPFIRSLINDYMWVDGTPLGERNPKWLQDDYVKFIRFGQWRIGQTSEGVLAYISNNGYLDNPTFRGMRQSLLCSFDEIYILNLHGNSKKKERAPDGEPDKNVFDIQQGVAIAFFVKHRGSRAAGAAATRDRIQSTRYAEAKVYYADLWGEREGKYAALLEQGIDSIEWQQLNPSGPLYFLLTQNQNLEEEYQHGWKVTEILPVNGIGMNTHRDGFVIDFDRNVLEERIASFKESMASEEELELLFGLQKTSEFNPIAARKQVQEIENWKQKLIECLYRPFDFRFLFLSEAVIDRPRNELNYHMLSNNLSLATTRQTREPFGVFATDRICGQHKIVATYDGSSVFPLYLYPSVDSAKRTRQASLFDAGDEGGGLGERRPNLSPEFIREVEAKLGLRFVPDGKGDVTQWRAAQAASGRTVVGASVRKASAGAHEGDTPLHESSAGVTEAFASTHEGDTPLHESSADVTEASAGVTEASASAHEVDTPLREGLAGVHEESAANAEAHGLTFGPEDIFHYTYAIFHSPAYRKRYAELLKIDFPRLPLTSDVALFADLAALGAELVDLHLLRLPGAVPAGAVGGAGGAAALLHLRTSFPAGGSNTVEQVRYDEGAARVYINKTQYFEGIDPATWAFRVGGYQVLDKWLKDRKGRALSFDDLLHYQCVVVALAETRRIMAAIDARIGEWPIP